ncbi:unnamed protein product [Rhizophagus irregularis]|nr:unnamed protein product [Rhizophagus irregularis]
MTRLKIETFSHNLPPPPPPEDYYDIDGNFDADMFLQYKELMEAYHDQCETAYNAAFPISFPITSPSTDFSVSSCPSNVVDNTTLVFLSDSDDELVDSDDESLFLPFDENTFNYHKTEWFELFFRSVCFSFIPVYIRSPSSGLKLSVISSRRFPISLPLFSLLDQQVICILAV